MSESGEYVGVGRGTFEHFEQSHLRAYRRADKHHFEGRLSVCIMEQPLTQLTLTACIKQHYTDFTNIKIILTTINIK